MVQSGERKRRANSQRRPGTLTMILNGCGCCVGSSCSPERAPGSEDGLARRRARGGLGRRKGRLQWPSPRPFERPRLENGCGTRERCRGPLGQVYRCWLIASGSRVSRRWWSFRPRVLRRGARCRRQAVDEWRRRDNPGRTKSCPQCRHDGSVAPTY